MTAIEEVRTRWEAAERNGEWKPGPGDALHDCRFEKAGFRAYRLTARDAAWSLVLSRVDVGKDEPRGLVTVNAPGHGAAFGDLDGFVMSRSVGVFGGTNLRQLAKALEDRLGTSDEDWGRRPDYLTTRGVRELQANAADETTFDGEPQKPTGGAYAFEGRIRCGRTVSLFGPGSSGKTTIAEGLEASARSGEVVVPGWRPVRPLTVGVLDWDEGREETEVRLFAIARGHGVRFVKPLRYKRMSRPLADSADEVGRWVVSGGVELLIVSPMNRALRSANGDPGAPVFELYEVLREFGTTNILIDHVVGAALEREAIREYGSVAKRDAVRGSWSVYEQSAMPGQRVVVLRNTKPDALAPKLAPEAVRIEFEPAWPDLAGTYDRISFHPDEVTQRGGRRSGRDADREASPDSSSTRTVDVHDCAVRALRVRGEAAQGHRSSGSRGRSSCQRWGSRLDADASRRSLMTARWHGGNPLGQCATATGPSGHGGWQRWHMPPAVFAA